MRSRPKKESSPRGSKSRRIRRSCSHSFRNTSWTISSTVAGDGSLTHMRHTRSATSEASGTERRTNSSHCAASAERAQAFARSLTEMRASFIAGDQFTARLTLAMACQTAPLCAVTRERQWISNLCYHPAKRLHTKEREPGMQTHLRPMSLGEILDRTAQLYRTNFILFAGIAAVYAGVLLVINLAQIGVQQLLTHAHMARELPWVTLAFLVLIVPVIIICAGASVAANNRAVAWVNLDQPATIRGAYSSILPRLGRYLWLMTIAAFVIYIPFVVLFTAYFVFLFAYARPQGLFAQGGANASPQAAIVLGLVSVGFAVLAVGALVYAVLMALRYSLAIPASVIEDLPARKALRRSIDLSKGSRGRIFVLGLLISVIQVGLAMVSQIFFLVAMFIAVKHHTQLPVWLQILQQIVGFFTNSFIGPMYATGLTLFYYDQRVRKEGYDIEWMMEAAGMSVPPAVTAAEPGVGAPEQSAPDLASTIWEPKPSVSEPVLSVPVDLSSETWEPKPEPAQQTGQPDPPETPHG